MRLHRCFLRQFIAPLLAVMWVVIGPCAMADDVQPATSSAFATNATGWEDIMPPANLKGWFRMAIPGTHPLGRMQWHVDNGTLVCDGDGGHDMLLLDRTLTNCIFHAEFCFTKFEGKKGYNSGVFIRTSRDGTVWHQAQVGSLSGGYWFGKTPDGANLRAIHAETKPCRVTEAGEWNTFELTAQGPKLTLWVNGYVVALLPDCGAPEGFIGLEAEGWHITFRNLKLKVLP